MKPYDFYQVNKTAGAISLIFCAEHALEDLLLTVPVFIQNILSSHQFKGKLGELCIVPSETGQLSQIFVGIGVDNLTMAIAQCVNRLPAGVYITSMALSLDAARVWAASQYRYTSFKQQTYSPKVLCIDTALYEAVLPLVSAVFLVRDLINAPPNEMGPVGLGKMVKSLAEETGASYQEWVGDDLLQANFPAIYTVGKAAEQPPRLLYLSHGNPQHPHVTLVGKGVTFDSGGLDLKSSSNMRLMKKDMGGAAIAIGLAQWIIATGLPVYLQLYVPAVENAVGSHAYRPGDIIKMRSGLTVEIENTDAEGRLILADALSKACEDNPALLIDFATLTGAARTAVGTEISAMFTPDDELAGHLEQASDSSGDPVWRLPLYPGYNSMLDSSVADLMNASSSAYAGAITAALFLSRFITPSLPWVHFDMMAWNLSNKPGRPEGGEAMGLLTVARYLKQKYA